ncbi:hypothetical protein EST38_g4514 [Candolleomyces aberdarensis]|uniref:DUF6535 domain-containing protein n=1 Tax=Candolleomyces aberdarensis TaxID=2316362 RepID=A0A4Q2DMT1_9AGAR|nr:hypothetical protein EST38_g4514 [Candolleomyces aberdarensis]
MTEPLGSEALSSPETIKDRDPSSNQLDEGPALEKGFRRPTVLGKETQNASHPKPDLKPLASGDPYKYAVFHKDEDSMPGSEAWNNFINVGRTYDENMCKIWKDEIDKLLVLATLFSAVVTSFIIEAYKLLQVDHQEVASTVLLRIHRQLDNIVRQNTSAPTLLPDPTYQFTPPNSAVAVNICLFLSLTLSLSTVSVAILCLQWLREYQREPAAPMEHMIAIRHFRLRGIESWWVAEIIGMLPVVLQISLLMFIVGIAWFLLDTNETVGIVVCCAAGITILIHAGTSIIPAFLAIYTKSHADDDDNDKEDDHTLCPYRSPHAWWMRRFILAAGILISYLFEGIGRLYTCLGDRFGTGQDVEANEDRWTRAYPLYPPTPHSASRGIVSHSTRWRMILKAQFKSKDWQADDVRHITATRMLYFKPKARLRVPTCSYRGIAWGLGSILRKHRHSGLALCVVIRYIGDMQPDHCGAVLEKMDAKKSRNLVAMLRSIKDTESGLAAPDHVMAQSLTLAHILDFLSENNAQFRLLTLQYRFELFLRTLNQYAEDFLIVEPSATGQVDPGDPRHDTSDRARWWGLIQKQVRRLFDAYQLGNTNTLESIPEDLQVEAFKIVYRYIEYAPLVIAEYVLVSSPLAKCWFLPLPPKSVIEIGETVNKRVEQLIAESEDSDELGIKAILYALRMSLRHIDYSDSFTSLVRAISRKMGTDSTASTADEARQIPLKDYPRHMRRWENLVQRIGPVPGSEGAEGIQL